MLRRYMVFFFVFLMLFLPLVNAESYTLPGETADKKHYNNIGLLGEVMMDINVTILNTAPFPKFVVVNPRYNFRIYRTLTEEYLFSFRTSNGELFNVGLPDLNANTLNYFVGFWIMPYETVVVNFWLSYNNSYVVKTEDYHSPCGNVGKFSNLTYVNGLFTKGRIYSADDITSMICGSIYPQLINSPKIMYVDSMFPIMDGYIKVLKYEGTVKFKITNVPNKNSEFYTFFAVSVPLIFEEARMYDFVPNYTMSYRGYMENFLPKYLNNMDHSKNESHRVPITGMNLFQLSPGLLSGVISPAFNTPEPREEPLDFPVWVVLMNNELEIRYKVKWASRG